MQAAGLCRHVSRAVADARLQVADLAVQAIVEPAAHDKVVECIATKEALPRSIADLYQAVQQ